HSLFSTLLTSPPKSTLFPYTTLFRALEEAAENILPTRFVEHTPLAHLTLETYTYYNDELHELSIYPFLMYANNQLISIGYLYHFDMDFLYLTDTKNTIIDERHLLKEGGNDHE